MKQGFFYWKWALAAGCFLSFGVTPVSSQDSKVKSDRFMELARTIQRDYEVVPIIENGRHALEAAFLTQTSPSSIMEAYRKVFESQNLKCQASLPTPENPSAIFRGYIGDEEKRLVMMPSPGGDGFLVRVLSYQNEKTFQRKHPSLLERFLEFKDLDGKVSFQKETFHGGSHSAILVYFSKRSSRDAYAAVRSRLEQSGWKEGVTRQLKNSPSASSKNQFCSMQKGKSSAVIVVTSRDQETNVVATVTTTDDT